MKSVQQNMLFMNALKILKLCRVSIFSVVVQSIWWKNTLLTPEKVVYLKLEVILRLEVLFLTVTLKI